MIHSLQKELAPPVVPKPAEAPLHYGAGAGRAASQKPVRSNAVRLGHTKRIKNREKDWYAGLEMSKRILLVTGDAGEGYEALYAYHRFQEEGMTPVLAAPSKRRLHLVMHDFEPGWDTYVERPGYCLEADIAFDQVNPADYDGVLILGGRAPEFLRHNQKLIEIVGQLHEAGKWVMAICHGIQVLIAAGVVRNRCVTCYENVRHEVELAGGSYIRAQAHRDGNLITAQTWQSHPEFYRLVMSCLRS